MNVRGPALDWLRRRGGRPQGPIVASRLYPPGRSRTGERAWWLEIPVVKIDHDATREIHLLCQAEEEASDFHYLKVPVDYFRERLPRLDVRANGTIVSLFLSAESRNLFTDVRGKGTVPFGQFRQ
jgi:hypothetical protein